VSAPRALVTGSTGFVGTHLVRHLTTRGWAVTRLLRDGLESDEPAGIAGVTDEWWDGSTDAALAAVGRARPEVVVHLASLFVAEHGAADLRPLIESNVLAGAQVAEAMLRAGCRRLVNTGTSWQRDASGAYEPVCLYAATKQAFEDLLAYYVSVEGFAVVTLSLFDTYGPGDRRPKLFAALDAALADGRPLKMSPGEQLLDLVHVSDVARAFEVAAAGLLVDGARRSERYDVSSGRPVALRDVVALYGQGVGRPVPVQWGGRPYRRREVMAPPVGRTLPGWRATIGLDEGLAALGRERHAC